MIALKCKNCGGDVELNESQTAGTCLYCASQLTFPKVSSEKIENLFRRAEHFMEKNEFDKAIYVYENIIAEDGTNAEAHWRMVECRFGIEYVRDPKTDEYKPTCHRASYNSIFDDLDYKSAIENALDEDVRNIYMAKARRIDEINREIIDISRKQEPFDVFICYKQTSDINQRTKDSVVAQDVYDALTDKGLNVFFAHITLENMLGTSYEPCIFSALNSAKVMLAFGSREEYFNAVWVKNEWSRYLSLIKSDKSKTLIPVYMEMDAYDIPMEMAHLQAQNMDKIGAKQDLVRGVLKILGKDTKPEPTTAQPSSPATGSAQDQKVTDSAKAQVYADMGFTELSAENIDKARECFQKAFELDFFNTGALYGMMIFNSIKSESQSYVYYKNLVTVSQTISDEEKRILTPLIVSLVLHRFIIMRDFGRVEYIIKQFPEAYRYLEYYFWRDIAGSFTKGWELLAYAYDHGLKALIAVPKEQTADTNQPGDKRFNILQLAMDTYGSQGGCHTIKLLLDKGADLKESIICNGNTYRPLAYAILRNCGIELVEFLLSTGSVKTFGHYGYEQNPLYLALLNKNYSMAALLIKNGLELTESCSVPNLEKTKERRMRGPLFYYILKESWCDLDVLKFMLGEGKLNVNQRMEELSGGLGSPAYKLYDTILSFAIEAGMHLRVIDYLISQGADVHAQISKFNQQGYHQIYPVIKEAITHPDTKYGYGVLVSLIAAGAKANATYKYELKDDKQKPTGKYAECPITYLCVSGNNNEDPAKLELLLKYGADPNFIMKFNGEDSPESETLLGVTAATPVKHTRTIELLYKYGAKPNVPSRYKVDKDVYDYSVLLSCAVSIGENNFTAEKLRVYLSNGEDPNQYMVYNHGVNNTLYETPMVIYFMLTCDQPETTKAFMQYGANPNLFFRNNHMDEPIIYIPMQYKSIKPEHMLIMLEKLDLKMKFKYPDISKLFPTTFEQYIRKKGNPKLIAAMEDRLRRGGQ